MPRNALFDNVKGILIFLVVFTHFLLPYVEGGAAGVAIDALFYFVFCFHMPFFVFISGYFSKDTQKARDTAFLRMLAPFLFFNTVMVLILYLGGVQRFSLVTPVYVNWYLLALYVWRVLLHDLVKIRLILPLSLVAALLVGFSPEVTNYLALSRIVAFLPFFLLGYFTPPETLERLRRVNVVVGLLGLALAGAMVYRLTLQGSLSLPLLLADNYVSFSELYMRAMVFGLALLIGASLFILSPSERLPFLTTCGENTLLIYVLHRYVTFAFQHFVPEWQWRDWYIVPVFLCSVVTTWGLGRPAWMQLYQRASQWVGRQCLAGQAASRRAVHVVIGLLAVTALGLAVYGRHDDHADHPIYPVMSPSLAGTLDAETAVTISFVGDMILLEDQVKHALNPKTGQYDFSPVFEHVRDRLQAADYAIGVLEVPLAGSEAGYSTSNFDDGIPLALNAPDSWASAIKNAGIDLVTTANNHVLDRGAAGARRTLDVLDRIGLAHVGSYRCAEDRRQHRVFVVEVKGIKLAFLAYTYGIGRSDGVDVEQFVGVLASPCDKAAFEKSRRILADDVQEARRHNPDLIIALPHMGQQFSHKADAFSRIWAHTMIAEGVDIVLACHSHAVQPMQYLSVEGSDGKPHNGFVLYCPGNFVNCYTEHDGDAAAIVTLHLNKTGDATSITAASIVPMWIQRRGDGQFAPIPVADALTKPELRSLFSTLDRQRIEQVHEIVTEAMLGARLTTDQLQDRYFYIPDTGYVRQPLKRNSTDTMSTEHLDTDRAALYRLLSDARRVVVLGDSITEGTRNGGYGWFEPLEPLFRDTQFINAGRGGRTTGDMIAELPDLPEHDADVVIVALGVNDVRYRDPRVCAMTEEAYIANIERIVASMRKKNPRAKFVMISVWPAFDNDIYSKLTNEARDAMIDSYNAALREYCHNNGYLFIDATTPIRDFLGRRVTDDYILDHIHPNADRGVRLYGDAVLFGKP